MRITSPPTSHGALTGVTADQHHTQLHETAHRSGGADALSLANQGGSVTDAGHGVRTLANAHAHTALSGVGVNDHHNQLHASTHLLAGTDAINTMPGVAAKTVDESVLNSTTLQNDDALFHAVQAGRNYQLIMLVRMRAATVDPDIKFGFTVPTGGGMAWSAVGDQAASGALAVQERSEASVVTHLLDTAIRCMIIIGTVIMAATAGNVQFQWAQNTLDAVDVTEVLSGSWMVVIPVEPP